MLNNLKSFLKKENFILLALIGILVFIVALPVKNAANGLSDVSDQPFTGTYSASNSKKQEEQSDVEELEERFSEVLSKMEKVGKVKVMITLENEETGSRNILSGNSGAPHVGGVLVVAQGAGEGTVNKTISDIAQVLFGIEAHKIMVVKMKSESYN